MSNYSPPPLPDPQNTSPFLPTGAQGGHWKSAPPVVRNWAYQLTLLGLIFLPVVIFVAFTGMRGAAPNLPMAVAWSILWCVDLWLNRALKRGDANAWNVQIVVSALGLLAFPVGTLIHAYVLSQWFKPETKRWFGR